MTIISDLKTVARGSSSLLAMLTLTSTVYGADSSKPTRVHMPNGTDVDAARLCLERGFRWFRLHSAAYVLCFKQQQPDTFDAEQTLIEATGRAKAFDP